MQTDETMASRAWQQAGHVLGIRIEMPFLVRVAHRVHECLAHLPDFGGPAGIAIFATRPPDFAADPQEALDAQALGLAYTFLNAEAYGAFSEELFANTLREWGYAGPSEHRPGWL